MITSPKARPVGTITIKIGKTKRTPKTAIKIPTVKKIVCQNFDILTSTRLFMTALSKLKVTSSTDSTTNSQSAPQPAPMTTHTAIASEKRAVIKKIRTG
ncbi:hypothetical protein D3C72_1629750 [compost metagenome]